ncbi:hypothetical protein TcasGA2_TC032847 [Tribolium castaneum]|uniref:Uncharacterized protein n=1 Tax=Tribolium castaneum TaxID=7070 RepID=A0A139WJR3_TRICA|nr:hypothetical protein TcasGA2_TC032847 [Tribolium castaneum]
MANTLLLICCLALLASAIALPATNDQLDKVTVNDVAANAVSPESKTDDSNDKRDAATVEITGITTGVETPDPSSTPFHPQRAGSMFARFIDDIFQIPINVLQNVARLITSPFVQNKKTPEASAAS